MRSDASVFVVLWEFQVQRGLENRFEDAYGPEGDWAQLFRRGEDYLGTELHRDVEKQGRYLTMDFWGSAAAYESFRGRHLAEYKKLDQSFEPLTEKETYLGSFARLVGSKR